MASGNVADGIRRWLAILAMVLDIVFKLSVIGGFVVVVVFSGTVISHITGAPGVLVRGPAQARSTSSEVDAIAEQIQAQLASPVFQSYVDTQIATQLEEQVKSPVFQSYVDNRIQESFKNPSIRFPGLDELIGEALARAPSPTKQNPH